MKNQTWRPSLVKNPSVFFPGIYRKEFSAGSSSLSKSVPRKKCGGWFINNSEVLGEGK